MGGISSNGVFTSFVVYSWVSFSNLTLYVSGSEGVSSGGSFAQGPQWRGVYSRTWSRYVQLMLLDEWAVWYSHGFDGGSDFSQKVSDDVEFRVSSVS